MNRITHAKINGRARVNLKIYILDNRINHGQAKKLRGTHLYISPVLW